MKKLPKRTFQREYRANELPVNVDLPTYIAAQNEEMIKIEAAMKTSSVAVMEKPLPTVTTSEQESKDWALAYLHNAMKVVGDDVQLVNFKDTSNLRWNLRQNNGAQLKDKAGWGQQVDVSAEIKLPEVLTGVVYVNQLPLNPATMPSGTPDSEFFRYMNYDYKPPSEMGWYVYGVIEHNFGLSNPQNFKLRVHSMDAIDMTNLEDLTGDGEIDDNDMSFWRALHGLEYEEQFCQIEGLDANRIIVHGVYVPDRYVFNGREYEPELYLIDPDNTDPLLANQVRTNIVLYYLLTKGE